MSEQRNWPAINVVFSARPSTSGWDTFCGMVNQRFPPLGVEEIEVQGDVPAKATFYFPVDGVDVHPLGELETGLREIAAGLFPAGGWIVEQRPVPEEDWGKNWRRHFHVMRVGQKVYVGPPWEETLPADAPSDAVHVVIDPGQAFGTGSHESTQLCLRLLESQGGKYRCLLDVGTGSGILCFAAIKLGFEQGIGVEYDPVCEENFYLNADLNRVRDRVRFVLSAVPAEGLAKARAAGSPAPDLIVCNMLSERFKPLLPGLAGIGLPLILSGFLVSEIPGVTEAAEKAGFCVEERFQLDEWTAFIVRPG